MGGELRNSPSASGTVGPPPGCPARTPSKAHTQTPRVVYVNCCAVFREVPATDYNTKTGILYIKLKMFGNESILYPSVRSELPAVYQRYKISTPDR